MRDWSDHASSLRRGANLIHFVEAGSGPPIVWVHGGGVDHAMWTPQLERFRATNRVIAYDLRGFGASTCIEDGEPDTEDLVALLGALGEPRIHLVGLSLGAMLGLDFALAHPDRVASLALLSPGVLGVQEQDPGYVETSGGIGDALAAGDMDGAMSIIERMTFEGRRSERVPGLETARAYLARTVRAFVAGGGHTRLPRFREPTPMARLGEIRCPTLIVHGSVDLPYMDGNVAALVGGLTDCGVVALDAGHMLNAERPEDLHAVLEPFFQAASARL